MKHEQKNNGLITSIESTTQEVEDIWKQMESFLWGACGVLLPPETTSKEYFHQGFTCGAALVLQRMKEFVKQ